MAEWKCTNFPITKYHKKLGTLGEYGEGERMTRTAYFRNGRWHRTLTPDPPQAAAEPTMLEAIRRAWQACRRRG